MKVAALAICALSFSASLCARSPRPPAWFVARNAHFEVYSQAGEGSARSTLARLEQLRAFFAAHPLLPAGRNRDSHATLRVICFGSVKDYDEFRLRRNADAYYVAAQDQAYIVMPASESSDFAILAHEYAHSVTHAEHLRLPNWLNEGLAEIYSTVRITNRSCTFGGPLSKRIQRLKDGFPLPVSRVLEISEDESLLQTREGADLFYAESWALANVLLFSPDYAPHFPDLLAAVASGMPGKRALPAVYRRPLDVILKDSLHWLSKSRSVPCAAPPLPTPLPSEVSEVSTRDMNTVLADVLSADGQLDRAQTLFTRLNNEKPGDPQILAGLGAIALKQHDRSAAIRFFGEAVQNGITDAALCYRYAVLMEEAGLSDSHIRTALERAVALNPDFDDARYKLALLESNAGHFTEALKQLHAMRSVPPARAYGYWSAISYASMESGDRDAAGKAAQMAIGFAQSSAEQAQARQLLYISKTDLAVQFAAGPDGRPRLVTTRVPHDTGDWNPFIEPTDRIQRVTGRIRDANCSGGILTSLALQTPQGLVRIAVPDPRHVLVRKGPAEFTCGSQNGPLVSVEYAVASSGKHDGILRGIAFR